MAAGETTVQRDPHQPNQPDTPAATPRIAIVGAGAAGLATAACLQRYGLPTTIYEAGGGPGATWRALYERLRLHTVKSLSGLPGVPMPPTYPRYPTRLQVAAYLTAYATHYKLTIIPNTPVTHVARNDSGWLLTTPQGQQTADILISATGVFSNPQTATYPNQDAYTGSVIHASAYHNAQPFSGQRVLIVGAGNSGAEIALDLAEHGVTPTIAIRAGAHVVPLELLGLPIQRWAHIIARLPPNVTSTLAPILLKPATRRQRRAGVPKPTTSLFARPGVPIIGLDLLRHARRRTIHIAGSIERFTPTGLHFTDGHEEPYDTVIMATGYRPALGYLRDILTLDATGLPACDGPQVKGVPNLYIVGRRYDLLGTLYNIAHEAPAAAAAIARSVSPASA